MVINENEIFEDDFCNEDLALACLIADGVCALSEIGLDKIGYVTVVYVKCSDVFAYSCADAENIEYSDGECDSEIISLYKMWKEHRIYGPVKWVSLKRNLRPIVAVVEEMKEEGYWDEELESIEK